MVRELLQPSPIRTFALKALGIFVLWYVLYELWLLPDGRLDHWVALTVYLLPLASMSLVAIRYAQQLNTASR